MNIETRITQMLRPANHEFTQATPLPTDEVALGALLDTLAAEPAKPLVFFQDGRPLKPGYHVTEVKAASFAALDCGANPEAWHETFVQLWDVDEGDGRGPMPAGKFVAILRKVAAEVPLDPAARLTFEVSDGVEPMRIYRATSIEPAGGELHVALAPRPASCKPRDRWLEKQESVAAAGCCGPAAKAPCCG
jgi:hypothetical protein